MNRREFLVGAGAIAASIRLKADTSRRVVRQADTTGLGFLEQRGPLRCFPSFCSSRLSFRCS